MNLSTFFEALIDLLPEHNSLKNPNNDLRKVLDNSVGEWFDNRDILNFYKQLFITTATGDWLDLHGRNFGVYRRLGETDSVYRERIVQEKLDHVIPSYLESLYSLTLYCYVSRFNPVENTLTSDNTYMSNEFMSFGDLDLQNLLYNKLILDDVIYWIYDDGIDYITDTNDNDVLKQYNTVHYEKNVNNFFEDNTSITEVKLNLFNANNGFKMFKDCTSLTSVKLNAPNIINSCESMFEGCSNLVNVTLNAPSLESYDDIFKNDTLLENINVNIPSVIVNDFKTYVLNLELVNLESFIVNGEEVEL